MVKAQKVTMWIFGLIIAIGIFMYGGINENLFVAYIIPIAIIGILFFFSFSKK